MPDWTRLYRVVGNRIREERNAGGMSQRDLARKVGLTRTSIANIEAGRQRFLLHTLSEFAVALNVAEIDLVLDAWEESNA